jgi:hypothetical protein
MNILRFTYDLQEIEYIFLLLPLFLFNCIRLVLFGFVPSTMFSLLLLSLFASACEVVFAYDPQLGFNSHVNVETRSPDTIYQAALKEGGVIIV